MRIINEILIPEINKRLKWDKDKIKEVAEQGCESAYTWVYEFTEPIGKELLQDYITYLSEQYGDDEMHARLNCATDQYSFYDAIAKMIIQDVAREESWK